MAITGTIASEYLGGTDGSELITGDDGNDTINAFLGADTVFGGQGNDQITVRGMGSSVSGDAGNDVLKIYGAGSTVDGGDGHDNVLAYADALFVMTGLGTDQIIGKGDSIYGDTGDGNDILRLTGSDGTLIGGLGDDSISANGQRNELQGGGGNDTLQSTDTLGSSLYGGGDNDFLYGYRGDDELDGGSGNDVIFGDHGNDLIYGGAGNDSMEGGYGDDYFDAGDGDDTIRADKGNDTIIGGAGADTITANEGNDRLVGGDGNDLLEGITGNDFLDGGNGDDRLYGGPDDDYLEGGLGRDYLYGGMDRDVFAFGSYASSSFAETDVISDFEQGRDLISIDVSLGYSDLAEFTVYKSAGRTYVEDAANDFRIAFNGSLTPTNADFDFAGTGPVYTLAANNVTRTHNYTEDIQYNFLPDVQSDTSAASVNTVTVTLTMSDPGAGSLTTGTSGSVTSSFAGGVWQASGLSSNVNSLLAGLRFNPTLDYYGDFTITVNVSNGSEADVNGLLSMQGIAVNDPPFIDAGLAAQNATEDAAFAYTFPANAFDDPEGDSLTYTATLAGGAPLPAWLTFNAATRNFSGTPTQADVGMISIEVTATDVLGPLSATQTFDLTVIDINDPPVAVDDALTLNEDVAQIIPIANLLSNDSDAEDGALLAANFSILTQPANGTVVNNGDGTVTFTPSLNFFGTTSWTYRIADSGGATDDATVTMTVNAVNDAPHVASAIPDRQTLQDTLFNFDITSYFDDVDGDTLTYTATLAGPSPLPGWLSFNGTTGIFSGTPAVDDMALLNIVVTANDGNGGTVNDTYQLKIGDWTVLGTPGSDQPLMGTPMPDTIAGLSGSDSIVALGDDDVVYGHNGSDTIEARGGSDTVYGGNGSDVIYGNAGGDELHGGAGSDIIYSDDAITSGIVGNPVVHLDGSTAASITPSPSVARGQGQRNLPIPQASTARMRWISTVMTFCRSTTATRSIPAVITHAASSPFLKPGRMSTHARSSTNRAEASTAITCISPVACSMSACGRAVVAPSVNGWPRPLRRILPIPLALFMTSQQPASPATSTGPPMPRR